MEGLNNINQPKGFYYKNCDGLGLRRRRICPPVGACTADIKPCKLTNTGWLVLIGGGIVLWKMFKKK